MNIKITRTRKGIYQVNGKTLLARTANDALKLYISITSAGAQVMVPR